MAVRVEAHAEPIPGYRLIDRLGGGGFGEVWRAEAPGGLQKAIKFVYGDLSGVGGNEQRAEQELKALKRVVTVRHPYILSLERYDIIDGQLVIVMELADRNLWDRFKECRAKGLPGIPRDELLGYMEETAEALDLMNREYQLQHLDIKPQNIFLVHQHVKVADFGLVKDLENSQASVTGGITPVYAAPETFDGKVSRNSDQYSLAIVYQELLTGQRPFAGTNVRQLIMQHLSAIPNVSPLPEGEQGVIARGLAKDPHERFPSCKEMVQMLRAGQSAPPDLAGAPVAPSRPTAPGAVVGSGTNTANQPSSHQGDRPLFPSSPPTPGSWPGVTPHSGPPTTNLRALIESLPAPPRPIETGSSQGATQFIRGGDAAILTSSGAPKAPKELTGPGCLFPALIIGLGQTGLTVMQRLRETLTVNVAPLTQTPHLRFLLIDTDPEVVRLATRGAGGAALSASEVLLAQLQRPTHYLKPRDGRPPLDAWLNPRMLYRIPRSQVTTGVRALGRLAFWDNYRALARRVQLELDSVSEPQAIQTAVRNTGLGLRTNRPRVYIITGLGGGTGGGMFIDLAYTVRALLRQTGYEAPDVIGLLLAPPVDGNRTRLMTLGNTYAALMELNYFGAAGALFQAKYHDREAPLQETGPPFTRNVVLPLPDESDEVANREVIDLCGQFLYRDLATPLGKASDLARAGLPSVPWQSRGQFYQTFNLCQLTWPRHALLQMIGRRLCQRIVTRWMSKDSKPLRDVVEEWVQEQWARLELSGDGFIQRLQASVVQALGQPVESLFGRVPVSLGRGSSHGDSPRPYSPDQVEAVLVELEALTGRPYEEAEGVGGAKDEEEDEPPLVKAVREGARRLTEEWAQRMAELSVHLIEEPAFRLAGAEEAARQLVASLERELSHNEPLAEDLAKKAKDSWECLRAYIAPKQGQRRPSLSRAELQELLRAYPKWRYQAMVLGGLSAAFVGLRGALSDQLRDVNFCRVRLGDLLRSLESPPSSETVAAELSGSGHEGIGRRLLPAGCRNAREAVDRFLLEVTAEHLVELDGRLEDMLREKFTALVHVCLTTANIVRDVELNMLEVARQFASERLSTANAAELFLEQHKDAEEAEGELARCFDEAAPELSAGRSPRGVPATELVVVATPRDEASAEVRRLLQQAAPRLEIQEAASDDDVVIYRERGNLALGDLEQFGPIGHDAYMQMSGTENFTPHTRADINFRGR